MSKFGLLDYSPPGLIPFPFEKLLPKKSTTTKRKPVKKQNTTSGKVTKSKVQRGNGKTQVGGKKKLVVNPNPNQKVEDQNFNLAETKNPVQRRIIIKSVNNGSHNPICDKHKLKFI